MKVYAKDSMKRFGDDFTEEILQYLRLEDKARLECVSKQWKRCVFQRQFVIEIEISESLHEKQVESVLKKCANITTVVLFARKKSEVLSLIGRYCPHIRSLSYWSEFIMDLPFLRDYGYKLEELYIQREYKRIKHFMQLCPNVKRVGFLNGHERYLVFFTKQKEFWPKLERIKYEMPINSKNVNQMKIFSDKYKKTMKNICFDVFQLNAKELNEFIECISSLENLRSLTVSIATDRINEPIDDCLSLIGRKCTKLLKLDLRIHGSALISHRLFDVFNQLKVIKKLKIESKDNRVLSGSVECFRDCKQLYDIDLTLDELNDDFFSNMGSIFPQLQRLRISTNRSISDSFVNSLHSRKSIVKVSLFVFNEPNNTYYKKCWYFGKRLFEVKASPKGKDVIDIGHNCGLYCGEFPIRVSIMPTSN